MTRESFTEAKVASFSRCKGEKIGENLRKKNRAGTDAKCDFEVKKEKKKRKKWSFDLI